MKLPLSIKAFRGHDGQIAAYIIRDAEGRSINLPCDINQLRRDVARLWSVEEAEALAKRIARMLTDEEEKG
ncbi:MAG: hypothetical protein Q7T60_17145 [Sphingopyxis sp.]|nr:hypothetical protein [Sphingopyxis sp.]